MMRSFFFWFFAIVFFVRDAYALRIVLSYPWDFSMTIGGGIMHTKQHAHALLESGNPTWIIAHAGSSMDVCAKQDNLPTVYFSSPINREYDFQKACAELAIDAVITCEWRDLAALKKIAGQRKLTIIYVRHMTIDEVVKANIQEFAGIDAVVGVNPDMVDFFKTANERYQLGIKDITWIAPWWDEQRFIEPIHVQNRQEFFSTHFNIRVHDGPLACMIANMINPCKNYPLLFRAMHELIYKKKRRIQLICAGDGILKPELEKLARALKIDKQVFFIGSTPHIPELLAHVDMHVLASSAEGFPIANLEAAALRKPIIAARGTGAAHFIEHGVTGLLFKNNDQADLIKNIELLLKAAPLCSMLGNQAYERVKNNFSHASLVQQWQDLLDRVVMY